MLVLSRKLNEEIVIGDNIRVKILDISGNRIRLGITAPDHVSVLREEIFAKIGVGADGHMEFALAGPSV